MNFSGKQCPKKRIWCLQTDAFSRSCIECNSVCEKYAVLYKRQFFYVETGVITEEMRKSLAARMAVSEAINTMDRYFPAIFIIGVFFIILFLVKSDKKYKLTYLIAIVLTLIITFVINIEFSIFINPRGGLWRENYYDIMRQMFWDNIEFVIAFISLAAAFEAYILISRFVKKQKIEK